MTDDEIIRDYMSRIGKKGGSVKSEKKAAASRENGKKGGWPKGRPRKKKFTASTKNGGQDERI